MEFEAENEVSSDVCDCSACNGMILKPNISNARASLGQCDESFPLDDLTKTYFCFVNEDSPCPKRRADFLHPGSFISTLPCEDERGCGAVTRLGFFKKAVNWFAGIFGYDDVYGMYS